MAYKTMQVRRDTAANWTSNNPTLASGEWGYETDTGKVKIGDGSTAWTSLSYLTSSGGGSSIADTDSDTYLDTEVTSDADTIVGYNAGTQTLEITSAGIVNLPKQSSIRVYKDSDQSFAINTWVKITFSDTDWDNQSEWSDANDRFTAAEDGVYDVSGVITAYNWTSFSAGGNVFAAVRINGATPAEVAPVAQVLTYDTQYQMQFAATVYLTAGDYIDFWLAANLAGDIRGASSRLTWVSVNKLS